MVRSNKEELAPLWDVCVHFLEIKAVVRLLGGGGTARRLHLTKGAAGASPRPTLVHSIEPC